MTASHAHLPDAGQTTHFEIDQRLPSQLEHEKIYTIALSAPVTVSGARDTPEAALANLLTALATLGLITDSTTAT